MKDIKTAEINITGIVQGVGFRPFLYNLARSLHLKGYVLNRGNAGVRLVLQGLHQEIKRFLDERAADKKKWKETHEKKYKSRSDISKVKANGGIYGNMGNPHQPFGFVPAAIGTTGIGRECAKLLITVLEKLYPDCVVEVDTDGVYFTAENVNVERIMFYFNRALKTKFKKDLDLTIDIDDYDCQSYDIANIFSEPLYSTPFIRDPHIGTCEIHLGRDSRKKYHCEDYSHPIFPLI